MTTETQIEPQHLEGYRNAVYTTECDGGLQISVGAPSVLLAQSLASRGATEAFFVTAHNPYSEILSVELNASRHAGLLHLVRELNWQTFPAVGHDETGVLLPEEGLFVMGTPLADVLQVASTFAQNAILRVDAEGCGSLVLLR